MEKKILIILIAVCSMILAFGIINVSAATSGTCGANLTWSLDNAGTLTISGQGNMHDYSFISFPWYSSKEDIVKVVIENNVTSIGEDAFYDCCNLTSIILPNSITSIGGGAFYNCNSLNKVCLTDLESWCTIEFDVSTSNPLYYATELYLNGNLVTDITFPDNVTRIGNYAFYGCDSLVNITIPDSVTSIGEYAFCHCNSLVNITIPDSVTNVSKSAFAACSSLVSITIGDSVTSIGEYAFYQCSNLKTVNITNLEAWCNIGFRDYSSNPLLYAHNLYLNGKLLTDIVIPDSVTNIGEYAFYCCRSIVSITISDSVSSIGDRAFYCCSSLVSITIPNSVTNIGNQAFASCNSLKSIVIPDGISSLGEWAFSYCNSLINITIPNSITSIENYMFYDCDSLISITIPNRVTYIGDYAFDGCKSLASIAIPDSVTSIGEQAFFGCINLTDVTLADGLLNICDRAFSCCNKLVNITLPNSVKSIGNRVFASCNSLTSITIPKGVKNIGNGMFDGCSNLKSVAIPDSIISIGDSAFDLCKCLVDIYYNGTEDNWNKISIGTDNESLINATIHYKKVGYRINEITLKDMSGNNLSAIPEGAFLTTVSFTNVSASKDTVIILAQYAASGEFKGLMYIQTEDVPQGSTIKLSIPVDNSKGDVAKLKAFCWESFSSAKPMGNSVSFPLE